MRASLGSSEARRPPLPDRNVTEQTIEDAYVGFILHCNPAVPPDTDPTALREAFRVPPKSEGKVFSTFTLYELIGKLMLKDEVKTWGDLALRLGVEPPNQEKNQSSQKIQQYAVRLKRWMKALHIDAFFDYLYDNMHAYWTQIPPGSTPIVLETARDGVLPEDDMALRALLPQIRPRRGRRSREEDEASKSPSKLPRLESPLTDEFATATGNARPDSLGAWSAQTGGDGRNAAQFPHMADSGMALSAASATPISGHPWTSDPHHIQTPLTAYPHSAITPSTRAAFWADEPRSAVTPSRLRPGHKRHGPKVVSSAWRSGAGGTGKTRGRPPINRVGPDGPLSAYPTDVPAINFAKSPTEATHHSRGHDAFGASLAASGHVQIPRPPPPPPPPEERPSQPITTMPLTSSPVTIQGSPLPSNPRPPRPGRLSLQVPKMQGGEIRLATPPPPTVMLNGQIALPTTNGDASVPPLQPVQYAPDSRCGDSDGAIHFTTHLNGGSKPPPPPDSVTGNDVGQDTLAAGVVGDNPLLSSNDAGPQTGSSPPPIRFRDPTNRTNMDGLEGFFVHEILTANWVDKSGKQIPPCGVDEAYAIVKTVIDNLLGAATTNDGFLINVAALAGGKLLMTTTSLKITLVEVCSDHTRYICDWALQLGDIKGTYSMTELVRHDRWKRPPDATDAAIAAEASSFATGASTAKPSAAEISGETAATTATTTSAADHATAQGNGTASQHPTRLEGGDESRELSAAEWKQKYAEIVAMYRRKDQEASRLQFAVLKALRDPRLDRDGT